MDRRGGERGDGDARVAGAVDGDRVPGAGTGGRREVARDDVAVAAGGQARLERRRLSVADSLLIATNPALPRPKAIWLLPLSHQFVTDQLPIVALRNGDYVAGSRAGSGTRGASRPAGSGWRRRRRAPPVPRAARGARRRVVPGGPKLDVVSWSRSSNA